MRVYLIPLIVSLLVLYFPQLGKAQDCDCFGAGNCPLTLNTNTSGQVCYDLTDAFNNDLSDPTQGICGVMITFSHDHIWDLELTLTSPAGQSVDLIGPNINTFGTTNSVLWDITFIPCAITPMPDVINNVTFDAVWDNDQNWPFAALFNGTYHPVAGNCLEDFNTGPANGTWCLEYTNQPSTFSGEILNFEVILCDNSGILCCEADGGDLSDYGPIQACEGATELILDIPPDYGFISPDTSEYGYTYVITDDSGVVLAYDSIPDMTTYAPGTYSVCGLSFKKAEVANLPVIDGILTITDLQMDFEGPSPSLCASISDFCVSVEIFTPPAPVDLVETICEGDTFEVGPNSFTETGDFQIILEASTTCDSIINLDLTVLEADTTYLDQTLCVNDSIVIDGFAYDSTDTYFIPFMNQFGCDSTLVLDLIVLDSIETFLTEQICEGESYEISGNFFNTTGNYVVPLLSQIGCDSIVYLDLTVVDIEIDFNIPDTLTCIQSMDTLFATLTGASGAATFDWSTGSGSIVGAADTDTIIVDAAGVYVLEVNDQGCVVTDSIEVFSNQVFPIANAGLPDTLTCIIDSLQLDANGSSIGPNITFQWNTSDGNFLSGTDSLEPWVDTSGTYQIIVLDEENGCSDTAEVIIVIDRTPPLADAGPDQVLDCVNTVVELDGSASLAAGNFFYEWTDEVGTVLVADDSLGLEIGAVGTYFLTVVNLDNGCQAVDSTVVTDDSDLPFVDAGLPDTINCQDLTVILDGSASDSGAGIEYLWFTLGGSILGDDTGNMAVAADSGWYFLQVLNTNNNCLAIDSVLIALDTITPMVEAGNGVELNCSLTEIIIGSPAGTSQGTSFTYTWTNASGSVLGNTITINIDQEGTYTLSVLDTINQCSAVDSVVITADQEIPTSDPGPGGTLTCTAPSIILNGGNSANTVFMEFYWYDDAGMLVGTDSLLTVDQPGVYCLEVVDGLNFCADTSCVEVFSDATLPLIDAGPDQFLDCINGEAILAGSSTGQGPPYVFEWSTIQGGTIISDSSLLEIIVNGVGTYELTVLDTLNDCVVTDMVSVFLDTMACTPAVNAGSDGVVNCFNFPSDTLNASNGTSVGPNISYQWTAIDGMIISGANGLMPVVDTGVYVLTVTNDLFGLVATDTVIVVADLEAPIADAGPDASLDCDDLNNNYQLDGSGSTISVELFYEWSTIGTGIVSGENTLQPVINEPGIYDLLITNTLNGCIAQDAVLITLDGTIPTPCLDSDIQIECGDTTAIIGDTCVNTDYLYQWTAISGTVLGNPNDPLVEVMPAMSGLGEFELFVTDTSNTCTASFIITVLGATDCFPDCVINFPDTLTCLLDTIQLDASGSSVGAEFVYDWNAITGNLCGDTTTLFPCVDAPGVYQLVVLDTVTNFSCAAEIIVNENIQTPFVDAGIADLINCSGDPIQLSGQSFPDSTTASIQWSGPDISCFESSVNNPTVMVSCAGMYYMTVVRADNGCSAVDSVLVQLDTISPIANIPVPAPITCGNGNTLLQSTGSSTGSEIIYTWTLDNVVLSSGPTAISYLANEPGNYCLEVLNTTNSCVDVFCQDVIQDVDLPDADAGPDLAIDCNTILVDIEGTGSMGANYNYQWTATDNSCIIGNPNSLSIQANCPGIYSLTVTDITTNCQSVSTMVVADSTQVPFADAGMDQMINCDSFQVSLDGTNSDQGAPYIYQWTANPGNIVSGGNGLTPIVNEEGQYQLLVENQNTGCFATSFVNVSLDAGIPDVDAGLDTTLSCAFPSIFLEGTSSINTASIVFSWEATQGGQISTGATTATPEVNAAGLYILTITDTSNGCFATDTVSVGLDTISPMAIINDTLPITFTCAVGDLTLDGSPSEPSGMISYLWETQNGNILSTPTSPTIVVDSVGSYQLTVTNTTNGCTDMSSITLITDFAAPTPVIAPPDELTCIDSSAMLDATGSFYLNPISAAWTAPAGSGLMIENADQLIATVFEPSLYFITLTYIDNGCSTTDTVEVIENRVLPTVVAEASGLFDCVENRVNLSGVGSSVGANYTYQWFSVDAGNIFGENTLFPEVDQPGTYGLEVLNLDNGCRDTAITFVEALAAPVTGLELSIKEPDCFANADARIIIDSITGGTPPFLYALNGEDYDAHIWYDYLEAGSYTLEVLDANECTFDTTIIIDNPEEVLVDLGLDVDIIQLGEEYLLEALVNLDEDAIDTVIWQPIIDSDCPDCLSQLVQPLAQTRYWVQVIDTAGCIATDNILINVETDLPVYLGNAFTPNGDGNNDVFYIFASDGVQEILTFKIFDRWGNQVFRADSFQPNNPNFGWDGNFQGKPMDPAVFVWWAEIRLENGQIEILKGDVTLIR